MTTIPFGPQLIGRTEKALNALLDRELSGTGLTEPQWVALTLTNVADGALSADALAARVAEALRIPEAAARDRLAELTAAGLAHETTDPHRQAADPARETADPARETTSAARETAGPARETAGPARETAGPARDTAGSNRETARQAGETPDRRIEPTERGRSLWRDVRAATTVLADDLWADLPDADRAAAARVLNVVLTRAGAALSAR
jgi:hypothetical protein